MNTKKFIITLEITLADLSQEALKKEASLLECEIEDLPILEDADPMVVTDLVVGAIENYEEMFAGSELYIQIKDVKAIAGDWKE